MIKKLAVFILPLMLLVGASSAEGTKKQHRIRKKQTISTKADQTPRRSNLSKSLSSWLNKMKKRVARSHAKHNQLVAVAAVRGSKAKDAPPLYWKGKKNEGPVDLPELEEFDRAVQSALSGNKGEAVSKLEHFIKTYPDSNLADDARHTLAMLTDEQKPE